MQETIDRLQEFMRLQVEFRTPEDRAVAGSEAPVVVSFDGPVALAAGELDMQDPRGEGRTVDEALRALWRQVEETGAGDPYPYLLRKDYRRAILEKLRWRNGRWIEIAEPVPLSA